MSTVQRRLCAIVCADVAGYSRLMGMDEAGTLAALKEHRRAVDPIIASNGGRIVKTTGDGLLIEFPSVVDAVRASLDTQRLMADRNAGTPDDRRMLFRIGAHLGDVIIEGDNIFGDGVNIAARLQELSEPGGICLSQEVFSSVRNKVDAGFVDSGEQTLKDIAQPVRLWRWSAGAAPARFADTRATLALPDKPSVAVLAFTNMSGDPEQEYFVDGITEDIITELSRFRSLFVIARNSSFSYKGKSVDVRQVGRELGVRYVLEGSIRKASNRIRVTGQLIDTLTGRHIWAEHYDRVLEDVFALQEELTRCIVRAIAPHISEAELTKVRRRRPDSLSAYEIAVRAHAKAWDAFVKSEPALCDGAISEARAALAIDADSTIALTALALAQFQHVVRGTAVNRDAAWREGMAAAMRSIEVDRSDGFGHVMKGVLLLGMPERTGDAVESARRGYDLNPHDMRSVNGLAYVENAAGNPERVIEHLRQALRISPRDPMRPHMHQQLAMAYFHARRYAEGIEYAQLGIGEAPTLPPLHAFLAANYVGLGELEKARTALAEACRLGPEFVERHLKGAFRNTEQNRRATAFMRVAAGDEDPIVLEGLR